MPKNLNGKNAGPNHQITEKNFLGLANLQLLATNVLPLVMYFVQRKHYRPDQNT
jgi:hypothetical protein